MVYHRNRRPHRHLEIGNTGADVRRLQIAVNLRLKRAGSRRRVEADGVYGPSTHRHFGIACHVIGLVHRKPTVAQQRLVRWPWLRTPAMKRRAQRRRPKRPAVGQLTPHFHLSEFACRDGTPVPRNAVGALRQHCQLVLEPQRKRFGACVVNSGYRTRAYNRRIGGAQGSYHIYDEKPKAPAVDRSFARGFPDLWGQDARWRLGSRGGVGTYPGARFIHTDLRSYPSNWRG